ncbi:hypothetical protein [Ancylobacter sp. FA202]|uniref:hypothetical protein n=1 Tax=Ancylobacter sp. FA202 TaxID=1111106 RepID=UPI00037473E4|nr:hypothetical protein [Ancylobacter sp. FA202]
MSLGDVIAFRNGSYEIRAIVDGRYVVRIRNRQRNTESYKVWTRKERDQFDREQNRLHNLDERARELYERHLSGETYAGLGREFGIGPTRVRQICSRQQRKERTAARPSELSTAHLPREDTSTAPEEWDLAKPASS